MLLHLLREAAEVVPEVVEVVLLEVSQLSEDRKALTRAQLFVSNPC